jgi:transposase-like protein
MTTHQDDVHAAILIAYERGDLIRDIAQTYSCKPHFVDSLARKAGLPLRDRRVTNTKSAPKRRKLSDDDVAQCVALYHTGISTEKLASRYGVNPSTICTNLKRNGVNIDQYRSRRMNIPVNVELCRKYYDAGMSLREIARELGVCWSVVADRLKEAHVILRPKNEKIPVPDDLIVSLYKNGQTIEQISIALNFSVWCVNKCLWDNNVETRKPDHPSRVERSRKTMSDRIARHGCVRVGKNEHILVALLREVYGEVHTQYRIIQGGHHFDAFAGGILWELDENGHRHSRQKELDIRYDQQALEAGFEVRRIWETDLFETGLSVWHNYQ